MRAIAALAADAAGGTSLEATLRRVTDAALRLLPADHASVRLRGDGAELTAYARSGVGSERPPPRFVEGEGLIGWVVRTGRVVRLADGQLDPRFTARRDRGYEVRSVISVPLSVNGRVLGVLSVSAKETGAFDEKHELVAVMLGSVATNAVRIAELEELAVTDAHTRAYNRRYLVPRLEQEMSRARRSGEPLTLLLMDLDHFKRVNDAHGHAAGDAVLCSVAERIRQCVRRGDVLVRRGGEEFVLVMPATPERRAVEVAQRIRRRVRREPHLIDRRTPHVQTISIGVATWDGTETIDSLERRADEAMYDAKHGGRDRVCVASSPPAPALGGGIAVQPLC